MEDVDVGISVASVLKVYVYRRSVLHKVSQRDGETARRREKISRCTIKLVYGMSDQKIMDYH